MNDCLEPAKYIKNDAVWKTKRFSKNVRYGFGNFLEISARKVFLENSLQAQKKQTFI